MFIGKKKGTHQAQEPMDTNGPMLRRTSLVWFIRRWTMRAWYILYGGRIRSWILNIASLLLSLFQLFSLWSRFCGAFPFVCLLHVKSKVQTSRPNLLPRNTAFSPNPTVVYFWISSFLGSLGWCDSTPWPLGSLGSLGASCRKGETGSAGTCWQVPGHRPRRPTVGRPWMPPPVTLSIPTMLGGFAFVSWCWWVINPKKIPNKYRTHELVL
jgi:hypothetical protein